jgi:hypothetical protein
VVEELTRKSLKNFARNFARERQTLANFTQLHPTHRMRCSN